MNEFFTWPALATYTGATLATALITQLLKDTGIMKRIPTRIFSYAVALVLLLLANCFTVGLTIEQAMLCVVNAVIVSLASNGAFDALVSKKKNE